MIPLKLHLKNFVSYGSTVQTINFEPYQLICLSGKNGHGKSALLDALTWVMWGQARKTSGMNKADEAVLRLGQTHVMVSLDFLCNNQIYRIRREYSVLAHKAQTDLELGIIDPGTGLLRALTDKTIRATQDKINTVLGLDYEAFVNSAFLRQGQSNEFSKKSPKDRKEILAAILQLDQYEKIKKRAAEKSREANIQKEQLELSKIKLAQDIAQKTVVQEYLREINSQLRELVIQEENSAQTRTELKEKQIKVHEIKRLRDMLIFKGAHLDQQVSDQLTVFTQESKKWRSILYKQQKAHAFLTLESDKQALEKSLQEAQAKAREYFSLKDEYLSAKEQEAQIIKKHQAQYSHKLDEIKCAHNKAQLAYTIGMQQLAEHKSRVSQFTHELQKYMRELDHAHELIKTQKPVIPEKFDTQLDKRKAFYHHLQILETRLETELKSIRDKSQMVIRVDNPQCFLCEQDLSHEHKKELLTKLDIQEKVLRHQSLRAHKTLNQLKHIIREQITQAEQFKKQIEEYQKIAVRIEETHKHIAKIKNEISEINGRITDHEKQVFDFELHVKQTAEELATHERSNALEQLDEFKQVKSKLVQIQQTVTQLNYKQQDELELQKKLQALLELAEQQKELSTELVGQEERKKKMANIVGQVKALRQEKKVLELELSQFSSYQEQVDELAQLEQQLTQKVIVLNQTKESYILKKGALEQEYKMFESKEKEYQAHITQIQTCSLEYEEYQAVASALSKDGVQALLIEDVIPEIEQEANKILARLTDNQAHLSIESLRDLRSGGTKETLDIKISDAIGIRPYELFSGGEAFRIDFALRIAISKLLARRAGTALQTLIIDEGFGSQDDEGLSNIMDAIHKIQEDFAKIIVVSHLPSLKDQFPVHFNIHKGPDGSTVKVIECS